MSFGITRAGTRGSEAKRLCPSGLGRAFYVAMIHRAMAMERAREVVRLQVAAELEARAAADRATAAT